MPCPRVMRVRTTHRLLYSIGLEASTRESVWETGLGSRTCARPPGTGPTYPANTTGRRCTGTRPQRPTCTPITVGRTAWRTDARLLFGVRINDVVNASVLDFGREKNYFFQKDRFSITNLLSDVIIINTNFFFIFEFSKFRARIRRVDGRRR